MAATDERSMLEETTSVKSDKHHLLWEIIQNCQANLSESEKSDFFKFLLTFEDIFAGPDDSLGRTSLLKHSIDTGTAPPVRQSVRRISPVKKQEVNQLLESMLNKDVIQPSCSPWAAPIVLVQKKDGSTRFCVDY